MNLSSASRLYTRNTQFYLADLLLDGLANVVCFWQKKWCAGESSFAPLLSANSVMLLISLWSKVRTTFSMSVLPRPWPWNSNMCVSVSHCEVLNVTNRYGGIRLSEHKAEKSSSIDLIGRVNKNIPDCSIEGVVWSSPRHTNQLLPLFSLCQITSTSTLRCSSSRKMNFCK